MIEILYFARLRERLGTGGERIEPPAGVATAGDLIRHLQGRGGPWAQALGPGEPVLIAVNRELARPETPLCDGDELGLFPPVTGG
jgi:molybdopterin synthase sulfur carrier subunit